MERYFAADMPIWRFARNTLVVSCLGLVPFLLLYVLTIHGFGALLMNNGLALRLFLRQVLTVGLVVVFVVNYLSFFLFAVRMGEQRDGPRALRILLIDPPLRVVVFLLLHALIYFLSADWFGSFGGDHWMALHVVGPTLSRSALFQNLSGVYFYATLGSAMPVYATAFDTLFSRQTNPAPFRQMNQTHRAAIASALGLFILCALMLTGMAALIAAL